MISQMKSEGLSSSVVIWQWCKLSAKAQIDNFHSTRRARAFAVHRDSSIVCATMKEQSTTDRYTLADLERWSEIPRDIDPPIRLGVFGDPVAHSLSPQMQ